MTDGRRYRRYTTPLGSADIRVLVRTAGCLNHAIERNEFGDNQVSHRPPLLARPVR